MSESNKLLEEVRFRPTNNTKRVPVPGAEISSGSPLKMVPATGELVQPPTRQSPRREWDALIQRLHTAGQQSREVEVRSREQEARIGQVLEEVREDINSANERVRAAEAKTREVEMRAEARILTAEERARVAEARAQAAEERAQHAEHWLGRVQETILFEFSDLMEQAAA